jgi:hypothetical protein
MRPFVPLSDGAQAIIRYGYGLGVLTNRLFFVRRSGTVDTTTLQALADGVQLWFHDQVLPHLSVDVTLTNCQAIDWTVPFGTVVASAGPTGLGGNSLPSYSANVAVRIRFTGAQPPRNFRGWHFLGGIPQDAITLNQVDSSFASALKDAYANLIDLASSFGPFPAWRWVVTSQEENGSPRSEQFVKRVDFIAVMSTARQRRRRLLVTG